MPKKSSLKSKKGLSPLIATSLLIAFAVALGSVVMNWSLNLGSEKSIGGCSNVEIKVRNINSAEVCSGASGQDGYLNFIIDNTGSADIKGIIMLIIGEKGARLADMENASIKHGALYKKDDKVANYDPSILSKIKQVQFIPKIEAGEAIELCPRNAVKVDKIGECA